MGRYTVSLQVTALAATTRYVLIDKSDTTGFPHTSDEPLKISRIIVAIAPGGDGNWDVKIGVVEEVDATNGSVTFFHKVPVDNGNPAYLVVDYGKNGYSIEESAAHMVGSGDVDGSTNWQSDTNLTNPAGTTGAPGAGDLVAEVTETDGTTTIDLVITVEYDHVSSHR